MKGLRIMAEETKSTPVPAPHKGPLVLEAKTRVVVKPSEGRRWVATLTGGPFSPVDIQWIHKALDAEYHTWRRQYRVDKIRLTREAKRN